MLVHGGVFFLPLTFASVRSPIITAPNALRENGRSKLRTRLTNFTLHTDFATPDGLAARPSTAGRCRATCGIRLALQTRAEEEWSFTAHHDPPSRHIELRSSALQRLEQFGAEEGLLVPPHEARAALERTSAARARRAAQPDPCDVAVAVGYSPSRGRRDGVPGPVVPVFFILATEHMRMCQVLPLSRALRHRWLPPRIRPSNFF